MTRSRLILIITLLVSIFAFSSPLSAQSDLPTDAPAAAGEAIRQTLFAAQRALFDGDATAAAAQIADAQARYDAAFSADTAIAAAFDAAYAAARAGDASQLAGQRALIWTGIVRLSAENAFAALESGDGDAAGRWLALREYRPSTRFSRPGADATLALQQYRAGSLSTADVAAAARADLYDTYQALLARALSAADDAHSRAFAMRRAEESGNAAGYFALLSNAYLEQRGTESAAQARAAFDALVTAAITGTDYERARTLVDSALTGFRAAPLSDADAARRAGQMLRFLSLVPVEYERGVRDGRVTNDIEIQEALTFREGSAAAFADIETRLSQIDAETTARASVAFDTLLDQIRAVADPSALRATADTLRADLTAMLPPEWDALNTDADADVILSVLDQVRAAVRAGDYAAAESARLEAYALLELGMEQRLRGFAPDKAIAIESLFWQGTPETAGLSVLLTSAAPAAAVDATLTALKTAITDAQSFLSASQSAPEAVAGNAAIIVFREGLEAVLILASLLASLRSVEERRYRRPLIMGAALALAASAATWWAANQLLTALMPLGERLEAIVSLIAIAVLLIITNWFFHKVYWTGWMANFHVRKQKLIKGQRGAANAFVSGIAAVLFSQTMGLILLGFTSIYREGFETVLFLQSLVLEAGIGVVMQGVVIGLIGVSIVGAVTFALQVRLPYKRMLVVTGVMIGAVLLVMVGHTVHTLQAVGWMPITPIQGVFFPYWAGQWFGLFATWQGIILQIAAGAFVIGSYFLAEYQNKARRRSVAQQQSVTA
jgi:high-affinity iron transporter